MPSVMTKCIQCNKEYLTDSDLEKSYCLFCGAENPKAVLMSNQKCSNSIPHEISYDPLIRRDTFQRQVDEDGIHNDLIQDLLLLWQVRYQPIDKMHTKYADTFLGLWILLSINARNHSRFGMKRARKNIQNFFSNKALAQALEKCMDSNVSLYHELLHSACSYVNTCKNDHQYGSYPLNIVKMKEDAVIKKIASETAGIMEYVYLIGLPEYSDKIINAIYLAYKTELPKYACIIDEMPGIQNPVFLKALKQILNSGCTNILEA